MSLDMKTRWEIVFLSRHKLGPKLSQRKIANHVGCSQSTVCHWLECFDRTGDVLDEEGRGRKRKTSEHEDEKLVAMATTSPDASSQKLAAKMSKRGPQVSPRTIQRRLKEAGFSYGSPLSKPLLSEKHCRSRLEFARSMMNQDWTSVLFTDETTFQLFQTGPKIWRHPNGGFVFRKVKHPPKLHVWGCFSRNGFGRLYFFKQNLNADLLIKIYEKALLPSAEKLFQYSETPWILQEDNDPKHTSKKAKKWRKENDVNRINWPSLSPDLNPIENLWGLLKVKVSKRKPGSLESLRRIIAQEWRNLPTDLARKLVDSIDRRIRGVVANNGDFTLYW